MRTKLTEDRVRQIVREEIAPPKKSEIAEHWCSFCGKANIEVRKLIAGPKVMICNECVGLCVDILSDGLFWPSKTILRPHPEPVN